MFFSTLQNGGMYGDLFVEAMKKYGILCIGIYRFKDGAGNKSGLMPSAKRFSITNPPYEFLLMSTDLVFCLMHFDPNPPKVKRSGHKHKKKKKKKDKEKKKGGEKSSEGDAPGDATTDNKEDAKEEAPPGKVETTTC